MSNQWNDNLRRRMEQYEASAPEGLFDHIMAAMPTEAEPATRPVAVWTRRIAIAAAVLLAVGAAFLTLTTPLPEIDTPPAIAEHASSTTEQSIPEQRATKPLIADATPTSGVAKESLHPTQTQKHTATIEQEHTATPTIEPSLPSEETAEPTQEKSERTQSTKGVKQQPTLTQRSATEQPRGALYAVAPKRERAGSLSLSLHTAGVATGKNMLSTQQAFMVNSVLYGARATDAESSDEEILMQDTKRTIASERHHRQPVRVGALLRYNITERWALESGLTYTKLSSNISQGSRADYYDETTSLHYLGLPLSAVFNIWQSRRFTLYVSAGGVVEKCIAGSTQIDYFLNKSLIHSKHSDTMVKPLQWSANAAAGAQFNLTRFMALYAEPSVTYRFDNGTKIETLYNERPLDFNLSVGLRFTLR